MKIDTTIVSVPSNVIAEEPARPAKRAVQPESAIGGSTSVQLSARSAQMQAIEKGFADTPVIDPARVAAIKQAISDGHFKIDAGKIADNLLRTAQELMYAHKA